jgi:hypothetical protein
MKQSLILLASFFALLVLNTVSWGGSVPLITETEKQLAIDTITGYPEVKEAAIVQKEGNKVNLAVIVRASINKETAQRIGDNFVRALKTYSQDIAPSKSVGKGIYDYMVGVYRQDESLIVMGNKPANAEHIIW